MMMFWLTIILLLLVVIALLTVPVLRNNASAAETTRDAMNKAFYQDRLRELEEDEEQGVISERATLVTELQQNLLEDIPEGTDAPSKPLSRWILLPGVVLLIVISAGFYLKVGGYSQVMAWNQVKFQLPELRERVMNEDKAPLSMEEIARLGLGLRTSLQEDPRNINDWMMLGRIGVALRNMTTATQAYAHAYQLAPDEPSVKLGYAEVMIRSNDPEDNKRATLLLREVIKKDHANLQALSLLAFNAFEQGDFNQAIGAWQIMLKLLPENDERREIITRSIAQAKAEGSVNNTKLVVNVEISPEAKKQLLEGGNNRLIVSVTDGVTPVPIAVKEQVVSSLPLSLSLDDSNAMLPERLLSAQHQVKVKVRLSKDGLAKSQSGDWYGESDIQAFSGKEQLSVSIDKQIP